MGGNSEMDAQEFDALRWCCAEVRNKYLYVYDIITKNEEKLRTPREHEGIPLDSY
jgi:hypothetical protein